LREGDEEFIGPWVTTKSSLYVWITTTSLWIATQHPWIMAQHQQITAKPTAHPPTPMYHPPQPMDHTPKFHRSLQKPMDQYRNPRSPWINHGCLVQSLYFETGVVYRLGNRMVSKSKRLLRRAAAQSHGIGTYTSVNKPDNSNNNPGKWAITDC
jgi:hypothetical protein